MTVAPRTTENTDSKKSLRELLSTGNSAERYRDHLGAVVTITGYERVATKNGEGIQFLTEELGPVWAPSVVARQVMELAEEEYLPARLRLAQTTSANGRDYFTLEDPENEESSLTEEL